jgi:hypothetical protein
MQVLSGRDASVVDRYSKLRTGIQGTRASIGLHNCREPATKPNKGNTLRSHQRARPLSRLLEAALDDIRNWRRGTRAHFYACVHQ